MEDDLDFDSILAELDMDEIEKTKECNDGIKSMEPKIMNNSNSSKNVNTVSNCLEDELKAMKAKVAELEKKLDDKQQETNVKDKILSDVDLFSASSTADQTECISGSKINSSKELKLSLFGDDSSDEESEKYPLDSRGLNEYGKFIKTKLNEVKKISPKKRIAVQKPMKSNNKSDANFEKEFYSGLRIINPLISSAMMKEKMEGRRLIKMSQIQNFLRGGDIDGDWVTIGVIISKTDPKLSSKGKTFSIWRMSDLRDCSKVVSFFLFGNVHKAHWKTVVGSVVGILNATSMPNKDSSSKYANELSFMIDHQDKVMILGRSKDLSTCIGRRKDGARCTAIVNKDLCEFCPYHIQSAYKKMSLKRMDLQASYSGPEPSCLKKKLFQNQQIFYGGRTYTSAPSTNIKKGLTLESLKLQRDAKNMQKEFAQVKKHLTPSEQNVVGSIKSQSEAFGEMMSMPSAGSRNLMKHILSDKPQIETANVKSISAADLLKMHQKEIVTNNKNRLANVPRLSTEETIPLEFIAKKLPRMSKSEIAKLRATQIIKNKGPILKTDPNAVKKIKSSDFIEKVKEKIEEKAGETIDSDAQPSAKRICVKDDEFERVLNAKSIHSASLADEENEKYFNEMETKEKIETQATSITELACKVVSCKKCKYTAFSASDLCKAEKHPLKFHSAVKRFFSCKNCKRRTISLNKIPTAPCSNCGEINYERSGMKRERSGPVLDSERLLLRGEEIKFLNK